MACRPARLATWLAGPVLAAGLAGCGSHHGNATAFCAGLRANAKVLTGNPRDFEGKKAVDDVFHRLGSLAPGAIAVDWSRLTVLVDKLTAFDPAKSDPFGDIYAAALDPQVQTAATHVRSWAKTSCGLDLSVTSGATLGTAPGTSAAAPPSSSSATVVP